MKATPVGEHRNEQYRLRGMAPGISGAGHIAAMMS